MTIRVVTKAGLVTVNRIEQGLVHTHTMKDLDRWKNPSFVRKIAEREVANGFRVTDVARNLRGFDQPADREALKEVRGRWMSLKDVHNAGAA